MDSAALEEKALELVEHTPNHYTKSSLAGAMGGRREDAYAVVNRLLAEGKLAPNKNRPKLYIPGTENAFPLEDRA